MKTRFIWITKVGFTSTTNGLQIAIRFTRKYWLWAFLLIETNWFANVAFHFPLAASARFHSSEESVCFFGVLLSPTLYCWNKKVTVYL